MTVTVRHTVCGTFSIQPPSRQVLPHTAHGRALLPTRAHLSGYAITKHSAKNLPDDWRRSMSDSYPPPPPPNLGPSAPWPGSTSPTTPTTPPSYVPPVYTPPNSTLPSYPAPPS